MPKKRIPIGKDKHGKPLHIGDIVSIEQAWEDTAGQYHDESGLTISGLKEDGTLRFRFGHWKTRTPKEQCIQAWINQFEWNPEDVELQEYA